MASPEIVNQNQNQIRETGKIEAPRSCETLRLVNETRAIIIFGRFAVGQSNLGRNISWCLGAELFDGGRKLRKETGNTPGTTEFMPRDASLDQDIDATQVELIKSASFEKPLVIVAKLGGYNAARLMQEDPSVKVVRVLVTCDRKEAAKRALHRAQKEVQEEFGRISQQAKMGEISEDELTDALIELNRKKEALTLDKIIEDAQKRERGDSKHWGEIYPELKGVDVYDPAALVKVGGRGGKKQPLFDIRVSTTRKTETQSVTDLIQKLVNGGYAEKAEANPAEVNPQPQGGVVFEKPRPVN